MDTVDIYKKANIALPNAGAIEKQAYVKGYVDGMMEANREPDDFYVKLAEGLRELWPPGEKDGKYPWRSSVKDLKTRLEFLWKDRKLKDKYTIDDCLTVARKYLSQYENNVKYMQTLKYFIFKQDKMADTKGKVKLTYKSTLADMLEDGTATVSNIDLLSGEII